MKATMTATERREQDRAAANIIVNFREYGKNGEYSVGITNDLSAGGACFEAGRVKYAPGEGLDCILKHPRSGLSLSSAATVVWKREGWFKCTAGIRFREMDRAMQERMSALISSLTGITLRSAVCAGENKRTDDGCSGGLSALMVPPAGEREPRRKLYGEDISVQVAEAAGIPDRKEVCLPPAVAAEQKEPRVCRVLFCLIAGVAVIAALSWAFFSDRPAKPVNEVPAAVSPAVQPSSPQDREEWAGAGQRKGLFDTAGAGTDGVGQSIAPLPESGLISRPAGADTLEEETETGRAPLSGEIDRAVRMLIDNPQSFASIEGQAERGMADAGLALRRALAVEKMLVRRGIDRKRIRIILNGGAVSGDTRSVKVIVQ